MEEFLRLIIFFRLHFPCLIHLRPGHEICLWLLDLHDFFRLFFPCANFFSYFARPPPLHKFANGPSLTNDLVFWGKFFIPWLILLFFSRLYLFSTFVLISHSSIENTFILPGDRRLAGWWPCRHYPSFQLLWYTNWWTPLDQSKR